jgi:hypothetical protein
LVSIQENLSPEKSSEPITQANLAMTGVLDSGSSATFLSPNMTESDAPIRNIRKSENPLLVEMPDGEALRTSHECNMIIQDMPEAGTHVHILPGLKSGNLYSLATFCDAGCEASFTSSGVMITHGGKTILTGQRDPTSKLWNLIIQHPGEQPPLAEDLIPTTYCYATRLLNPKIAEIVRFMHAALFSPLIGTLLQAVKKGFLNSFPGLAARNIKMYPPVSKAMAKGHMNQECKNQRSSSDKHLDKDDIYGSYFLPDDEKLEERTHDCYVASHWTQDGQIFTDQTGKFLIPARSGNTQIMIMYIYDANAILAVPMKSKMAEAHLEAYKTLVRMCIKAGFRPKLQKLDNEASQLLREYIDSESIQVNLVPPGIHHANAAERAIQTFKAHFIVRLSSLPPEFPLNLWDKLIQQSVMTINMLRASRLNPKLSAYAIMFGEFNFDRTPLAPPGTPVIVHEKPDNRKTWVAHGVEGFYIGPAMDHYRCFKAWIEKTQAERTCDTL